MHEQNKTDNADSPLSNRMKQNFLMEIHVLVLILLFGRAFSQGSEYTSELSSDDAAGLQALLYSFTELAAWKFVSNPCGYWTWIACSSSDPPRVTAINLSGQLLYGSLPDFSQMEALETIDLSDNEIHGSIPEFLGTLPKLRELDLQNNQLSGDVPKSITKNKQLKYNVEGNPKLHSPKKKNLGLIIGLPVGLAVGIALPGLLVYIILKTSRKKPQPIPGQGQITMHAPSSLENDTLSSSQVQLPQHGISHQNYPASAPDLDQNELNVLLQLHNNRRS